MGDMMTFPETVEEFMEQYKITDTEHVYTNGVEMVPIFRMKQWFDHQKSSQNVPNYDFISRKAAIEVIDAVFPVDPMKSEYAQGIACGAALAKTYVEQMPPAHSEIIRCEDCGWSDKRGCALYCRAWNRYTAWNGWCHQRRERREE